jgi:tRNA 2-thiouridine synthesizing protein A
MLYQYDAHNDKCPLPLVKMRVILKKMQTGDICMIRIKDKGSKKNIPDYLKKSAWLFTEQIIDNNILELKIEK